MKNIGYLLVLAFAACGSGDSDLSDQVQNTPPGVDNPVAANDNNAQVDFFYGADLSYVNEMEDCGATYFDLENKPTDPYEIFANAGSNLVRIRLWNNPDWTSYSTFQDAKKSISRAKKANMKVLLDFHYSDSWADPGKQVIPAAWLGHLDDINSLGDMLYDYTYTILEELSTEDLLPDFVQVGNEINTMILQRDETGQPMDWNRNSFLINKGIQAVRDISKNHNNDIEVMLHVAQPENGLWWFEQATANGITDYDWIALSYYPKWSTYSLSNVGTVFKTLIDTYKKRLMVVETAYPFTLDNADAANNILNKDALIDGYPATQQGQLDYLNTLQEVIETAGGEGLVYWEPAWVSTRCRTLWGQGSHWDNATLFDHQNKATMGMGFYGGSGE